MYEQTQFDLLRPWIIAATELPDVILSHPSAPRPQTDYAMLNLTRSDEIGRPASFVYEDNPAHTGTTDAVNPPIWELVTQEYEFTWTLSVYARDPLTVANRLNPWRRSGAGREMLDPLNLFAMGPVNRIPEMVNNNWQERAVTELRVRAYVCTGTVDYATQTILTGRVPADVAEIVNLIVDGGNGPGAPLEIAKP